MSTPSSKQRLLATLSHQGLDALESLERAGWALFDLAETAIGWKGTILHHGRGITLVARSADLAVGELARCVCGGGGSR